MTDLTSRQLQVAQLVRDGWTDKQIAAELQIDEETVAYHLRRIATICKLDRSRSIRIQIAQLVRAA